MNFLQRCGFVRQQTGLVNITNDTFNPRVGSLKTPVQDREHM